MSSRHDKNRPFGIDLPGLFTPDRTQPTGADAGTMDRLQVASTNVLQLATLTHEAVARGDAAAAEAARASLEKQLALSTGLIEQLLFDGTDHPTTH